MPKYFYTHLISVESLIVELDQLDLSESEKKHLADLADSTLHQSILDAILSQLNDEDKHLLIKHLHSGEHDRIWEFLNSRIDGVEEKIVNVADGVKKELHKDIKEAKEKKLK